MAPIDLDVARAGRLSVLVWGRGLIFTGRRGGIKAFDEGCGENVVRGEGGLSFSVCVY